MPETTSCPADICSTYSRTIPKPFARAEDATIYELYQVTENRAKLDLNGQNQDGTLIWTGTFRCQQYALKLIWIHKYCFQVTSAHRLLSMACMKSRGKTSIVENNENLFQNTSFDGQQRK